MLLSDEDATPLPIAAPPMSFRLDHDHGWDDGMWCGGILDVHVELLAGQADAARFAGLADDLRANRPATVMIPGIGFRETIEPAPPLVIAGAGHVAGALAPLAATLGFAVTVVDDRPDVLLPRRFPGATLVCGTIDLELNRLPIDENTFVVIITRGHHRDAAALSAVINRGAKYVGMIGSKRKVRTILGALAAEGIDRDRLANVRAPIGLEIGAVTVEEIAVSIAAELTAVRRGEAKRAGEAMQLSRMELDTWIDRDVPDRPVPSPGASGEGTG
jgi:xanthine/CO dehydrogenase XdhC/CoxF family maturation factor